MDKTVFHRCQNASSSGDKVSQTPTGLSPGLHSGTSEVRPQTPIPSTPAKPRAAWPNFTEFFVHVACGGGLVLLYWEL